MAANSAHTNASSDHKSAKRPAPTSREAPDSSTLEGDLDAASLSAGQGPIDVIASLPAAPPEVRARVMGRLQRLLGNEYVQRVVSRTREGDGLAAARAMARPAGQETIRRAPPTTVDAPTGSLAGPTVGNQTGSATSTATKTAATGADADPLDADEVKAAIDFHVKQPGLFPPALIKKIQARLSVDETGVTDEDTVQAIARFQLTFATAEPPLKVDGKAGPRTLPMMFPSGLADEKHEKSFAKAAHDIFDEWDKLKDAKHRALALVKKVNHELSGAGVPSVNEFVTKLPGGAVGEFDAVNWIMLVDPEAVSKDTPTDEEAGEIVNTIYHEARHAEQSFLMARLLRARGKSAAEIADEMPIPAPIATVAAGQPLRLGTPEAVLAQGLFDETYGVQSGHTAQVYATLSKRDAELKRAQAARDKNPTPENEAKLQEAFDRLQKAQDDYENLVGESDAFHVGGQAKQEFQNGSTK